MQLADAPCQPTDSMGLRQTMHRVRAWLKRFTATEGETGSADASGCEPAGAESSSTLVDVPSSSNTCSPSSERQLHQHQQQQADPHVAPVPQQPSQGQQAQQAQPAPGTDKAKPLMPDTRDFFAEYGEANRYLIREVIGKGSYGIVCSAVDQFTGERVAIKKITNVFEHVSDATRILREIKLLRMLKHPDIVDIKHIMLPPSSRDFKDIYVVFELMETDLHQVIKANDDLTPDHHQFFLYQMLRGLKYIHSAKVFHRDLKPKNILANSDCKLKICDFGLARPAFNDVPTAILWTDYVATRWYRAPELCGSFFAKYSPAIDIWSVGCIFAEVLLGKPLFPGKNVAHQLEIITDLLGSPAPHVLDKVRNEKARRFLMSMRPKPGIPFQAFFPRAAPGALALLRRMLSFDPAERPTAEEALADPYFAGLHSPSREPVAQPISKLAFEFDRRKLEMGDVRELIYKEILEYHPQVLRSYLGHGMRSAFVNPSSLDNFKRQFMHLEANPGAVLDIRGSAAAASAVGTSSTAPAGQQAVGVNGAGCAPRAPAYNYQSQAGQPVDGGALHAPDSHARRIDQEAAAAEARARERHQQQQHAAHAAAPPPPYAPGGHAPQHHAQYVVPASAAAAQQQQARAAQLQQQAQQMHAANMYAAAAAQQHAQQMAQQQHHSMQGAHYAHLVMQQQQQVQQQAAAAQQAQWAHMPVASAHHHAAPSSQGAPSWGYDSSAQQQPAVAMPQGGGRDRNSAGKDRHLHTQLSAPMPSGSEAYLSYNTNVGGGAGTNHMSSATQDLTRPSPMDADAPHLSHHQIYAAQAAQQGGGGGNSASSQGSSVTQGVMSGVPMDHASLCGGHGVHQAQFTICP